MTNHEKHILLWDELARTGSNNKNGAFVSLFPEEVDTGSYADDADCWACEEAHGKCDECPIDWGTVGKRAIGYDTVCFCLRPGSLFRKWTASKSIERRKILAAQIRDLPWMEK